MFNRARSRRQRLSQRTGTPRQKVMGLVLTAVCALVACVAIPAMAGASQSTGTKLVPGLLTKLSLATFLKDAPATTAMTVGVGVAQPNPTAEKAYYDALYQQGSPTFHDFLTPRAFNAKFGITASTVSRIRSFLTSTGAQVSFASDSGDYFTLAGTVAQVQKLFNVTIGEYSFKGTNFLANNRPASVPAALPINDTLGLNTYEKMSLAPMTGHRVTAAKLAARADAAEGRRLLARRAAMVRAAEVTATRGGHVRTSKLTTAQTGTEAEFTPQDLWGMYDDPGAAALTNPDGRSTPATLEASTVALGQGQTIGVFGAGEMASVVPQLRLFEEAEGLPKVPVRTVEAEGAPDSAYGGFAPDAAEWYLDSQSSTGMAPDVKQLDLYFAKNFFDADIESIFSDWAGDPNGPEQMNASFGECEGNPLDPIQQPLATLPVGAAYGYSLEITTEATLEKAAMEGRTLFTSAGDTGSGCPEIAAPVIGAGNGIVVQPVPEVGYPCASAYAVCVGGTVLSSKGPTYPASAQRDQETSWTYGGGGTSLFLPEPSFQKGVTAINTKCVSQPDGSPYATTPVCRGVPDVSDLSGNVDGDGYIIYSDGSPSSEGGTSLSSPLMVGQWARIQSAASAATQKAGGIGFAAPTIYNVAKGADACNTGDLFSAEAELSIVTPCTDKQYENDFYDVTESEDVGDNAGAQGAGAITGFNNVNTGVGTSNGAYFPAPGWDYDTGWGALNVANFMTTVDGTNTATDAYTGTELPAINVSTMEMTGPADSAADPVSGADDPGLNITGASLSATASTVTATITAPQLSAGDPADATGGDEFSVDWDYKGQVYYAEATESPAGAFSYSSGTTKSGFAVNTTNSAATGTANLTTGQIAITVPVSEVGSPARCSALTVPQSFSSINLAAALNPFTLDELDVYRGYSVDGGQSDSIGENVIVGGTAACGVTAGTFPAVSSTGTTGPTSTTSPTTTKPTTAPGQVACQRTSKLPVTHITRKFLTKRAFRLSGTARAHCPDTITKVGLSIARVVVVHRGKRTHVYRCEFLTARHRWARAGSCAPRDYFRAKGLGRWTFSLKLKFKKGTYRIWEHATDSKRYTTRNVAAKFVYFRIR